MTQRVSHGLVGNVIQEPCVGYVGIVWKKTYTVLLLNLHQC